MKLNSLVAAVAAIVPVVCMSVMLGGCAPLITAVPDCETVTYLVERVEADGQIYADIHERCD